MSTASDQYFLSYVKKTTAGIGLKANKNKMTERQNTSFSVK